MKPMRILMTGAAGMLCSALHPYFRGLGHAVRAMDLISPLEGGVSGAAASQRGDEEYDGAIAWDEPDVVVARGMGGVSAALFRTVCPVMKAPQAAK
ncbi:MAG: NAD(P)-dependent oxidoreductase [Verrucomicrobia bacterium]|nr:NAD(P)-dependent oxidoreductase [Verrucomicrobiota bacterium]